MKVKGRIRFRIKVINWIRICIKVINWIRIGIKVIRWIRIRISDDRPKHMEYLSLFEHFFKVLSRYLEARIRIRICMKVKGRIRIWIRMKVTNRIRIRIKVASRICNTGYSDVN
jgi:hypothetical protein